MKILIVTHYFLPHIGGIEIVAYNQAKQLVEKGHKVTILTSNIGKNNDSKTDGIKIVRVKALNIFEKYNIPYPIFSISIVPKLIKHIFQNDIVHIHGALYLSSFFAVIISRLFNKKIIMTEHVGLIKYNNIFYNLIEKIGFQTIGKFTLNRCNNIIVLNDEIKNYLQNLTSKQIVIFPNGVDTDLFHPVNGNEKMFLRKKYNLPVHKKLVLFVGRFVEKKGLHLVFESKDEDYDMVLVGNGEIPPQYAFSSGVHIFNSLSQDNVAEIYQACDIFLLPSHSEGCPLSIQEAIASGLPVVTTNNIKYLDKVITYVTPPKAEKIRSTINRLLRDNSTLLQIKKYSRGIALKYFSWVNNVNQLLSLYEL